MMPTAQLPFFNPNGPMSTDGLLQLEGHYRIDSIVLAFECALQDKHNPTEAERVILAVEAVEREVNNGGFNQFFFNSSRVYAYFAPIAFLQIGAPLTADLCSRALALVTRGQELDHQQLQNSAADMDDEREEQLDHLSHLYFRNLEEPLAHRLFEFIKLNREHINASAP